MSAPKTEKEKERFVELLMAMREFLRTEDDQAARKRAAQLVDELAKDEE